MTVVADENATATILCPACRVKKTLDTSIPLPLVDRTLLTKLVRMKGIPQGDATLDKYRELLNRNFESRWKEIKRQNSTRQGELGLVDSDGLGF